MNGVSLFANVGIAEFYLKDFGIDICVANELLEKRCFLYKYFFPDANVICGDITKDDIYYRTLNNSIMKDCEFLIATPPCQGMSIAGKMDDNDPRNNLIIKAIEFIKELIPKYGIIENVPKFFETFIIHNGDKVKIKDYIIHELGDKYNISMGILDASDHGTPQFRKRAITLISRKDIGRWELPEKQKRITVMDAIGHLPSLESGEYSDIKYHYAKNHSKNHILWMRNTPTGKTAFENEIFFPQKDDGTRIKGFSTTYKRIDRNKPAPTITMCNGAISSQNNVHPGRELSDGTYSDARVLSLKEIFILTGLPNDIEFPKRASDNFIRQVIGEGIPPRLISEIIKTMPKDNNENKKTVVPRRISDISNIINKESLFVNI